MPANGAGAELIIPNACTPERPASRLNTSAAQSIEMNPNLVETTDRHSHLHGIATLVALC